MKEQKSGKIIAQLDLSYLSKNRKDVEGILDVLIAELRKEERNFSWNTIKNDLRKKGRL